MIRARQIVKRFGATPALTNVTLDVSRGECVVLAGPAGAGRSTLLRVLATLIPPDSGTAEIDGFDVLRDRARARTRAMYIDGWIATADGLRVDEYLRFVARSRTDARVSDVAIAASAKRARLDAAARVDRLDSTGRARLALACGLASRADALLLDEPLARIDAGARPAFVEWIAERCAGGTAILAACGDACNGSLPADRVIVMDSGRALTPLRLVAGAR